MLILDRQQEVFFPQFFWQPALFPGAPVKRRGGVTGQSIEVSSDYASCLCLMRKVSALPRRWDASPDTHYDVLYTHTAAASRHVHKHSVLHTESRWLKVKASLWRDQQDETLRQMSWNTLINELYYCDKRALMFWALYSAISEHQYSDKWAVMLR